MTIIKHYASVKRYPLIRISEPARSLLERTISAHPGVFSPKLGYKTLIGLLECYLDLRLENLPVGYLRSPKADSLFAGFVGALRSNDFVNNFGNTARFNYISVFRKLLETIRGKALVGQLVDNDACDAVWLKADKNAQAGRYWRGWFVGDGTARFLELHWVWGVVGEDFCGATHEALNVYWAGRDSSIQNSRTLFNQFFQFIALRRPDIRARDFASEANLDQLFREFCKYYFVSAVDRGLDLRVSRKRWNDWRYAVVEALFKGGKWAWVHIPSAGSSHKPGSDTWIKTDGDGNRIKEKFLVDIPLEITDEKAIEGLIKEVNESVETIVSWATHQSSELIVKHQKLEETAKTGKDLLEKGRIVGNARVVSKQDLTATFLKHGLDMFQRDANFVGVINFSAAEAAEALAIPVWNSLEPFIYLLINENQKITDAFLKSVEVYDDKLSEKCFRKTDEGYLLIGYKHRKGAEGAEQTELLNSKSLNVVQNIISLTAPLREWMRRNGAPNWNRLLLSCSRGLSSPGPMRPARKSPKAQALRKLWAPIAPFYALDAKTIDQFCRKLSFTSFRATKALSLYFKDGDEVALAYRLGHTRHNPQLMQHYLPEAFRNYLKSRSITITQTLMVAYAMKDSPLLVAVTGFKSIEKLQKFLKTHKFRELDMEPTISEQASSCSRILINMHPQLLGQLAALTYAATQPTLKISPRLVQWIEFAQLLFAEGKRRSHDTKLQKKLLKAIESSGTDRYLQQVLA